MCGRNPNCGNTWNLTLQIFDLLARRPPHRIVLLRQSSLAANLFEWLSSKQPLTFMY